MVTFTQIGEWYFAVRPARAGDYKFIAWCAKTPDLGNGPLDVDFADDDVHAAFADTAEEALNTLKSEVLH